VWKQISQGGTSEGANKPGGESARGRTGQGQIVQGEGTNQPGDETARDETAKAQSHNSRAKLLTLNRSSSVRNECIEDLSTALAKKHPIHLSVATGRHTAGIMEYVPPHSKNAAHDLLDVVIASCRK